MSPNPTTRIIAMMAALAVVLAGLLPVAHLHVDDDHQVVHQHAIADGPAHSDDHAGDHDESLDHPGHTAARILTLSYDLVRHVAVRGPIGSACWCAKPEIAQATPVLRTTLLPTHDPPLRFVSSPAPPAVV